MKIACQKTGSFIPSEAEVLYSSPNVKPRLVTSRSDGSLIIPDGEFASVLKVMPLARNWTVVIQAPKNHQTYYCPWIEDEALATWRSVCGVAFEHDGNGSKIGVIDIGFSESERFTEMEFISYRTKLQLPEESHGSRVARIIGKKDGDLVSGICRNVNIIFFDVGFNDLDGKDAKIWETEALIDGIYVLAEEKECLIINISGGLVDGSHSPGLRNAIAYARKLGTICVVAAGNNPEKQIFEPASYQDAVAVGGIGVCSHSPYGTYVYWIEEHAKKNNLFSREWRNFTFFHDVTTTYGTGLDVVAPSIGIALPVGEGQVADLTGTSYAAPIVSSVLAISASNDMNIRLKTGEERWHALRSLLNDLCFDIGLPKERQGMGIPFLKVQP